MLIEISENIAENLVKQDLNITDFLFLVLIEQNQSDILKILDNSINCNNNSLSCLWEKIDGNICLQYQKLFRKGLIELSDSENEEVWNLNKRGIELLKEIKN